MSIEQKIRELLAEQADLEDTDQYTDPNEETEEEIDDELLEAFEVADDLFDQFGDQVDDEARAEIVAEAVRLLPEAVFGDWAEELGLDYDPADYDLFCEEAEAGVDVLTEGAILSAIKGIGQRAKRGALRAGASVASAVGAKGTASYMRKRGGVAARRATAHFGAAAGANKRPGSGSTKPAVSGARPEPKVPKVGSTRPAATSKDHMGTPATHKAGGSLGKSKTDTSTAKSHVGAPATHKDTGSLGKSNIGTRGTKDHVGSGIRKLPIIGGGKPHKLKEDNMQEYVDALTTGEDLSEEFKERAATIFEAAVIDRVRQETEAITEAYQDALEEEVEAVVEGLIEKVDGYLDYVVEQWMEQNEIALERGMRSEILENFVGGLKTLFEENYIDVPEDKFDVVDALQDQVSALTESLNDHVATNVELTKALAEYQKDQVVADLAEGLVATDKDRFRALVEDLDADDVETFEKKAQTIRESYFTTKAPAKSAVGSVVTDTPVYLEEETNYVDPSMRGYLSVLDNLK